jgi:succinoglycan biosynthesis transport protein ExoP
VLRSLEGVASSYQQLFENFLVRYTQVVQDESYPVSEARVVSPASPPLYRSQPRTMLLAVAGAMLGIGFGFALAFLLEAADRRLRTPMQARAAIGGECVGIIPHLRRGLLGSDTAALMREVLERPNSRFSEAMHGLQTRIAQHCLRLRDTRVIACVGASEGAGTSTVAAALALCLAQSGRRTVLLDWDLREGTTSAALAPEARAGFLDVFEGRIGTMDALLRDPQTGLRLLARGQAELPRHPAGILGSDKARTILGQLRAEHDFVVVDLPALGQLADAHAAAAAVDGFLFVLEWGGPGPHVIAEVLSRFDAGSAVSFGAVLNKVDIAKALRYVSLGEAAYIRAV